MRAITRLRRLSEAFDDAPVALERGPKVARTEGGEIYEWSVHVDLDGDGRVLSTGPTASEALRRAESQARKIIGPLILPPSP